MSNDRRPTWQEDVNTFYAPAFHAKDRAELAASMAEWAHLTPEERSFAASHLSYLQLRAQAAQQSLLAGCVRRLDHLVARVPKHSDELLEALDDIASLLESREPEQVLVGDTEDPDDDLPPEAGELMPSVEGEAEELDGQGRAPDIDEDHVMDIEPDAVTEAPAEPVVVVRNRRRIVR